MKKLNQDKFEQGRVLERVAQNPLVLATAYNVHNSVILGSNENLDVRVRDDNSVEQVSNEMSLGIDENFGA